MGECIRYRGREVKIGTCENLYYTSHEKYVRALNANFLQKLDGKASPLEYVNVAFGFRFRFPFPDEDKLPFGEIIEPFDRGVPISVSNRLLGSETTANNNTLLDIMYQKPVIRESDGKFCLAVVFREPSTRQSFSVEEDEDIRKLVTDMVRNNVLNENDPKKKSFYRTMAVRAIKGYGLNALSEYKQAVRKAGENRPQAISGKRNKGFKHGM